MATPSGAEEEIKEEEEDDQADILWGRPRRGSRWSTSSAGSDGWSVPRDAEVSHSTAPLSGSDVSFWSSSTSASSSASSPPSRPREAINGLAPQYEVFLWHHKQLALTFAPCPASQFPFVVDASSANVSLPGMWHVRAGDVLLAINDCSTHASELTFEEVEQVLDSGVRPAILRLRRPTVAEVRARELRPSLCPSPAGGAAMAIRRDILRQRERCEASLCYVIWREEVPALGLRLQQRPGKPYPEVEIVRDDGAAARPEQGSEFRLLSPPVQPGDWLLSINDWSVHNAKFHHVLQVLHHSPRPLVLTFRRIASRGRAAMVGERTFDL